MKTNKQGVSLIVLVITIIVMIVLASAVILSLNQGNIREKANAAVDKTNLAEVQQMADLAWADAYVDKLDDATVDIEARVLAALAKNKVDTTKYFIDFSSTGVSVKEKTTIRLSSVSKTETILKGTTKDIGLTAITEDDVKLTWSSNNESVATVVGTGSTATVTLKAAGTAVITVTGGGDTQTCTITVTELTPTITLDKTSINDYVPTGSTKTVQLVATTENIETLTWSSNNTDVATVVGSGNTATVTLKSAGTAVITVIGGGVAQTCQVTVSDKEPKIAFEKTEVTLRINKWTSGEYQTSSNSFRVNLENVVMEDVVFSSDNTSVATIGSKWSTLVTINLHSVGTAVITATANGVSTTLKINVEWSGETRV